MSDAWHDQPHPRAFLTAVQFLSQIPVPGGKTRDLSTFPQDIRRGLVYFPLVGAAIGLLTAGCLVLGSFVLPFPAAVIVALAFEARLTGAFHEDAVADFCDAFGGGWTREDTLRLLKDSRIGSFGALGLGLAVALRSVGLVTFDDAYAAAVAIVLSGCIGRLTILGVMSVVPPVPARDGLSKDVGQEADWRTFATGSLLASPVLAYGGWFDRTGMVVTAVLVAAFVVWFRTLLLRRLGGVTGDCLGSSAYVGMVITTLVLAREV